jgi:DNA-binding response OmpR family regulator
MATIVIGEDNADLRDALGMIFRRAGHDVTTAPDGPSCLQTVREHPPDLLVVDVSMPGMTGLEVCRAIRADEAIAELPILMVSAWATVGDAQAGRVAGAGEYVAKPFSTADLLSRADRLLAKAGKG